METYSIVLADDSHTLRSILRSLIEGTTDFSVIGEADDGEALIDLVLDKKPDIVLADISMPKMSGMSAIKECLKYQPDLKVIFVTGFEQYAVEAFGVAAVDYLVKPIQMPRLRQALDKAKLALQAHVQRPPLSNRLLVRTEGAVRFVPLDSILYIEKFGRSAIIHTKEEMLRTQTPLHTLMKHLSDSFVLAHRSYIINLTHISSIVSSGDTYAAYFRDYDKPAYISKHKYNEVVKLAEGK